MWEALALALALNTSEPSAPSAEAETTTPPISVPESAAIEKGRHWPKVKIFSRTYELNPIAGTILDPQATATVMTRGGKVYSPSECVGAVVNNTCHGSIIANPGYHPTCHGEMINGMCTGPMF